nr:hypothetical protein CFP56_01009 [Quercus suber]
MSSHFAILSRILETIAAVGRINAFELQITTTGAWRLAVAFDLASFALYMAVSSFKPLGRSVDHITIARDRNVAIPLGALSLGRCLPIECSLYGKLDQDAGDSVVMTTRRGTLDVSNQNSDIRLGSVTRSPLVAPATGCRHRLV